MAGFQKNSYYAWQVSIATRRLSSKLAHGLRQRGGLGRGQPPPHCKHNARLVGFRNTHMLSSKLTQAGGWGQPPCLETHRSHGEWRGFKKTQLSLRQHYLITTVLTAVIVICIWCIYIYICTYTCVNICTPMHMDTCVCMYIYIYIYICIYIHTHPYYIYIYIWPIPAGTTDPRIMS